MNFGEYPKMPSTIGFVAFAVASLGMMVSPVAAIICPEWCLCRHSSIHPDRELSVDCSNKGFQDIPTELDPSTVHLDLSGNQINRIATDAFQGHTTLETIKLSDNWITDIESHAFKGLRLRHLDLSRNNLAMLDRDSLGGLRGRGPCTDDEPCSVNLAENHLRVVKSYSLSWNKGMSVYLGNSSRDLTIEAYAFYGADNITEVRIGNLPSVSIEPRVFTNTMSLKRLVISHTQVKSLQKFTFEGLRNIEEISFQNCYFNSIDEFSFSGVIYKPYDDGPRVLGRGTEYTHLSKGGLLNISNSVIPSIKGDTFRDTNLMNLSLVNNHINSIEEHAFRGLHKLSLLEVVRNTIAYVQSNSFGGLRNIPHIKLVQNDIGTLEEHAFRDTAGVERLSLHLRPNSNLTLRSYSFSGLRDVGTLEIRGAPGSSVSFDQDAFHDLGGVRTLHIFNVSLPTLGQHTFRGLSKVQTIKLEYCNISKIDAAAFGEERTVGSVARIEVKDGNKLSCDCDTNKLLRDFESRFSEFTLTCYTKNSEARVLTAETLHWPSCKGSSAVSTSEFLTMTSLLGIVLMGIGLV